MPDVSSNDSGASRRPCGCLVTDKEYDGCVGESCRPARREWREHRSEVAELRNSLGHAEAELSTLRENDADLRAQLAEAQERNRVLTARCDELAGERDDEKHAHSNTLAKAFALQAERDEASRIAGVMERSSMAATQRGWEVDRHAARLERERAERDDVIRELAGALRAQDAVHTDFCGSDACSGCFKEGLRDAALARVDAMTGGER